VFPAVKYAEKIIQHNNLNKEYLAELEIFNNECKKLLFGEQNFEFYNENISSIPTIGGTGAIRLLSIFL